ncbi:flavodoxin domain-containing protein, partial [Serratia marcescens]|uniref:flavodoxin domain-containing protein n=1 Tax=Serratia marcescens TaxID=615 RepID=UPI001952F199
SRKSSIALAMGSVQTGNAEEFAAATAERLTATGHRATLVGMDDTDVAQLPRTADLLLITLE